MPRKTKDVEKNIENEIKSATKSVGASIARSKKTSTTKSTANTKSVKAGTNRAKKTANVGASTARPKEASSSKNSKKSSEKNTKVKAKATKSVGSTVARPKKSTTKSTANAKNVEASIARPKATTKSSKTTKAKSTTSKTKSVRTSTNRAKKVTEREFLEYYDLPYRYNETVVKILAQTPKRLFIYWDISDTDRKNFIDNFGNDFFNNTVPVLIIHNTSMNYTFEVEINDFANCWYLDINDTKCEYTIELGRRAKNQNYYIPNNYVYVTSSNKIESPNDHILFEKQSRTVYFRNVKNNNTYSKDIASLSFIRNIGKIYSIYDAYQKLYSKIYGDEDIIDINNPSSNNPTSTFK